MNKKVIGIIIAVAVVALLVVLGIVFLGNKPQDKVEGELADLMTKLYANIPEDELPMLANTEVSADNVEYFLGTSDIQYTEGLASEPMMSSIAHSVVLIRVPEDANVEEVKDNCSNEVFELLSQEDQLKCEEIKKELGQEFCRRCGYCAPCPQGINIPSNFLFVNYLRRYGLASWAKDRYWSMKATAQDCIKCGLCESRCPYNLPIRSMLEKVAEEMK